MPEDGESFEQPFPRAIRDKNYQRCGGRIRLIKYRGTKPRRRSKVELTKDTMGSIRQPSRILKRRQRSGGPAERTVKGVPAFFVGAYVPEDLYGKLVNDASQNERS